MPDFSNPVAGLVTDTRPNGAFIQILGSPYPPLEHCWHVDDDRLANGYEQFQYNQELLSGEDSPLGPRTGVFRKSRNQSLMEGLPARLAQMERMLTEHTARLAALEKELASRPKRGRPPKKREPEGAMV